MSAEVLPPGWARATLGELGIWTGGGTPSKGNDAFWRDGSIPWVSPKDMKALRIAETKDYITEVAVEQSSAKLIAPNSIAFVVRSGILNHTLPVALIPFAATVNQDLRVLTPAPSLDVNWLLWTVVALAPTIRQACQKDGTTVASINVRKLQEWPIAVPPRQEQERIARRVAELMATLDDARACMEGAIGRHAELANASLQEALWVSGHEASTEGLREQLSEERKRAWEENDARTGRRRRYKEPAAVEAGPPPPAGCVVVSTDAVAEFVTDGDHNPPPRVDRGVPHLTGKNVLGGTLDFTDVTFITEEDFERVRQRYEPQGGDVVVTCVGTIGRVGVVPAARVFSPDRNLAALRPLPSVNPEYLRLVLDTPYLQRRMQGASGSTAQPHLYLGDLRKLPVPLPPREIQDTVVETMTNRLHEIREAFDRWAAAAAAEQNLRAALLRDSLLGLLVPQIAEEESADLLLDRIRAEVAAARPRRTKKDRAVLVGS